MERRGRASDSKAEGGEVDEVLQLGHAGVGHRRHVDQLEVLHVACFGNTCCEGLAAFRCKSAPELCLFCHRLQQVQFLVHLLDPHIPHY